MKGVLLACAVGVFVLACIAVVKNEWTFYRMESLDLKLFLAVQKGRISHDDFIAAHREFPSYDTVANDLTCWNFERYLSKNLKAVWRNYEGKNP